MLEGERRAVVDGVRPEVTHIRAGDANTHEHAPVRGDHVDIEMPAWQEALRSFGERAPVGRLEHDQLATNAQLCMRERLLGCENTSGGSAAIHDYGTSLH